MAKQKKMKTFSAAGRRVLPKDDGSISSAGFVWLSGHKEQQKVMLRLLVMLDDSLETSRMILRRQIPAF